MSGLPRLTAREHLHLIHSFEDQALLDLVEDMVKKLDNLGDRLEAFAESGTDQGEASDGSHQ